MKKYYQFEFGKKYLFDKDLYLRNFINDMLCRCYAMFDYKNLPNTIQKQDIEKYRQDVQAKLNELNKDGDENNKEVCWYLGSKSNDVETRIMINPESPFAGQKFKTNNQKQEASDKKWVI